MWISTEMEADNGTTEESDLRTLDHKQDVDNLVDNHESCRNGVLENENRISSVKKSEETDADMEEEVEKADGRECSLFQLSVVNSYGSQEVQKLKPSTSYKFTSE